MSALRTEDLAYHQRLESARLACDWTQTELWLAYRTAKGSASQGTMEEWLRGNRDMKVSQFVILAHVIDTRLQELGKPPEFRLSPSLRLVGDNEATSIKVGLSEQPKLSAQRSIAA